MSESKATLHSALVAVMQEVEAVSKTGFNKAQGYAFASDADVLRALKPAMTKHGITMLPLRVESSVHDAGVTRNGAQIFRTDVLVKYQMTHTSGECIEIEMAGAGSDTADKGIYKALTGALKYALFQAFLLARLDDSEDGKAPESHVDFQKIAKDRAREVNGVVEPVWSTSANGARYCANWQDFVNDGLISFCPVGAKAGTPLADLSASEIDTIIAPLTVTLAGSGVSEALKLMLSVYLKSLQAEIARRDAPKKETE